MAAGKELNPTEYIGHHLTHDARPFLGDGGFWTVHLDSVRAEITEWINDCRRHPGRPTV